MSRYDKINPKNGSYRASLAADLSPDDVERAIGVGHDSQGRLVKGSGNTGVKAILVLTKAYKAGYRCDPMQSGEIVEFGPTIGEPGVDFGKPGTVYYSDADGNIEAGTNEVQTVTVTSSASPFVVTYSGQPTSSLSGTTTTALQFQAALEALSNLSPGDVSVAGPTGGPFVVTFAGSLAATDVAAIVGTTNASVATTAAGGGHSGLVEVGWTVEKNRLIVRVK